MIDKNEFSLFVYQMNAVLSDEDIRRYMADLRGCLPANYPYEYLARYVERCDLRQTSKNSAPSPTTSSAPVGELTMAKFIDYLVSAFGGMTASAQSVKARAETVRKQLGLSLDNMVKDEASTQRTLERIDAEMTDKNLMSAQTSKTPCAIAIRRNTGSDSGRVVQSERECDDLPGDELAAIIR